LTTISEDGAACESVVVLPRRTRGNPPTTRCAQADCGGLHWRRRAGTANSARHRWIACRQRGSRALGV